MQYVNLGASGLKVSRICLGCMSYGSPEWRNWVLDEAASMPFFESAIEHGINFFDTADVYSKGESERLVGRAIKSTGRPREEFVVATKAYFPLTDDPNGKGLSRKHIRHAIEASLERLDMDYVDLYQIHRLDQATPMMEILAAMSEVVDTGLALYIGASSMSAWQFAKLLYLADQQGFRRFVSMQNHYNLIYREEEREMLPLCRAEGIGLIPWSPLARGFLTGNRVQNKNLEPTGDSVRAKTDDIAHRMYYQDDDFAVVDALTEISRKRGVTNAQVALAWVLQQPGITAPIIGGTQLRHIEEAVAALKLRLNNVELEALAEPYRPHPVLGH